MTTKPIFSTFALGLISVSIITSNVLAQWVPTNGPYGGNVTCFAAIGNAIFAAVDDSVYRSSDNGASWAWSGDGIKGYYVNALASDGTNLFAGSSFGGVFRSTDRGLSWVATNAGLTNTQVETLAVIGSKLFAGTLGGIFLSTDSGITWNTESKFPPPYIYVIARSGTNLFAGTGVGILESTDSGISWTATADAGLPKNAGIPTITSIGTDLFVGSYGGIYRSSDSGTKWFLVSTLSNVEILAPDGKKLYAGTSNGLFLSQDSGKNWAPANVDLTHTQIKTLLANDTNLLAGTAGQGIFRSTNAGEDWIVSSTGLPKAGIRCLAVNGQILFAGAGHNGAFFSTDDGKIWSPVWTPSSAGITSTLGGSVFALAASGRDLVLGCPGTGIFHSSFNGMDWIADGSSLVDTGTNVFAISGANLFASSPFGGGVFRSSDFGTSWSHLGTGIPDTVSVLCLVASGKNLFAGTTYGSVPIYRSTDSGISWQEASSELTGITPMVNTLAVSGKNIFAGTYNGIYCSTDSGTSWAELNSQLRYSTVSSLAFSGTTLFASVTNYIKGYGFGNGVILSTDSGKTWANVSAGLIDSDALTLTIGGTNLFAGSAGVWRRPLSEMIPPAAVKETPVPQIVAQAYPDPFPTQTSIHFSTAAPGFARVTIVNVLGEEVAQLYSGELSQGEHAFEWNAADAPAGTYFCIIQTSAGREVVSVRRE